MDWVYKKDKHQCKLNRLGKKYQQWKHPYDANVEKDFNILVIHNWISKCKAAYEVLLFVRQVWAFKSFK